MHWGVAAFPLLPFPLLSLPLLSLPLLPLPLLSFPLLALPLLALPAFLSSRRRATGSTAGNIALNHAALGGAIHALGNSSPIPPCSWVMRHKRYSRN